MKCDSRRILIYSSSLAKYGGNNRYFQKMLFRIILMHFFNVTFPR